MAQAREWDTAPFRIPLGGQEWARDRRRTPPRGRNSFILPIGRVFAGLAAVAGREKDFAALFAKALDYVVAIGGTSIHVLAGIVPPHERPAAEKVIVGNLQRAADAAAEKNIFLMLEPLNQRDRPDYFVSQIEHIAHIIARVGKPKLKIMYDIYHVPVK